MKITVTGSLGNISTPLATQLIQAGHTVTIVSSSADKKEAIEALGAIAAIGSVTDQEFVNSAFTGADAVYAMVPPTFAANNLRLSMSKVGETYAAAIKSTGVKHVVFLSSIGAHLDGGTGPIAGVHDVEKILNKLEDISLTILRPASFYNNYYGNIPMIKHMGILGANYPADTPIVMVHPHDIADAAFDALQQAPSGKTIRYVASDEHTAAEVAGILGAAIGKPGLPWVEFTDQQSLDGMLQAGLPAEMAAAYVEMGTAIRSGILWEDYKLNKPVLSGRKLEAFAKEFGEKYNG